MKQIILTLFFGFSVLIAQGQMRDPVAVQAQQTEKEKLKLSDEDVSIYPNPSSNGMFTISAENLAAKKVEIRIMNVIGNEVLHEVITNPDISFSKRIDLNKYAKGLYYVKLETDKYSVVRRVVIK
jgi:hypothetical protein